MLKDIKNRLSKLEKQVFAVKEEKNGRKPFYNLMSLYYDLDYNPTMVQKVDELNTRLKKLQERFDLLLKHFKLEYHKITDENGTTTVSEGYKKAKKQKKVKIVADYKYDED